MHKYYFLEFTSVPHINSLAINLYFEPVTEPFIEASPIRLLLPDLPLLLVDVALDVTPVLKLFFGLFKC